jgi:RNA polymerase sigma-70 factor (ECF subfamily)
MTQVMAGDSRPEHCGADEDGADLVAARGDPSAFIRVYDRNNQRVLAYFYRRTMCPHTSAELAAETFAQAWTSLRRFDPGVGTGRGWLFGIAGNLYKQWLRRGVVRERARRRLAITTPTLKDEDLERIDDLVDTTALRAELMGALDQLSPAVRDAVLLRVALDLPYDQVATTLGCSVGAARVRVARGLSLLIDLMEVAT